MPRDICDLDPANAPETHWSYGHGQAGCLYDSGPGFATTREDAIECALAPFEADLPESELALAEGNLRRDCIHYFACPAAAGADYVEINECDGPLPEDCDE